MVAVAVAERVRDKNRNLKYHAPIPFYGKKGCSAKLLLFSYAEFFFSIFHCGENEKIISILYLDTENLMFFSVAQWDFCQSDVCFAIYLGIS